MKKIFIKEHLGRSNKCIEHLVIYDNGKTAICTCSKKEWRIYEIKEILLKKGVDKKLIEEFYQLAYSIGSIEESLSNAGPEL